MLLFKIMTSSTYRTFNKDGVMEVQLIPYNTVNKLITYDFINNMLRERGITKKINNIDIFQKSMTHKSYIMRNNINKEVLISKKREFKKVVELQEESNEVLELLGDTVIKLIVTNYLEKRYHDGIHYNEKEGFITRLKTKIENRSSLARLAKIIGLDKYLLISTQIENKSGRSSDKILEDTFEAFFGALFRDSGFNVCEKFLVNVLESEIDYADLLYNDTNYKDQLLRYYHKNKWNPPQYILVDQSGPSHERKFIMGVLAPGSNTQVIASGKDTSKRSAEQQAAKKALIHYCQLNDDQIEKQNIILC